MNLSTKTLEIVNESQSKEKLEAVIMLLETRLAEHEIVPTELQWTILINHLNEMLKRSTSAETIPDVDPAMFTEVSKEALTIAAEVVETIGNLTEAELYVLSIHFEAAKNND